MKIKFIQEPKKNSLGDNDEFVVGKTYDLKDESAERWIRRGVAEIVIASKKIKE